MAAELAHHRDSAIGGEAGEVQADRRALGEFKESLLDVRAFANRFLKLGNTADRLAPHQRVVHEQAGPGGDLVHRLDICEGGVAGAGERHQALERGPALVIEGVKHGEPALLHEAAHTRLLVSFGKALGVHTPARAFLLGRETIGDHAELVHHIRRHRAGAELSFLGSGLHKQIPRVFQ